MIKGHPEHQLKDLVGNLIKTGKACDGFRII
jgi:hypothetical protein